MDELVAATLRGEEPEFPGTVSAGDVVQHIAYHGIAGQLAELRLVLGAEHQVFKKPSSCLNQSEG